MIRIEDFGEIVYGGAVTLTEWWDQKRISDGKITDKEVLKKASFYTYFGVGLAATMASVFGWMKTWALSERWAEKVSTGFLYDLPRVGYNLSRTMAAGASKNRPASDVVQEAQRILRARQEAARQLTEGNKVTDRTYQPEYESVGAF